MAIFIFTNQSIAMNEILEALKSKFEGVSAKQLEVKARAMAKKGQTAADVEKVTIEGIIEAYADSRTNDAIAKYKADNPPTGGKPGSNPDDDDDDDKGGKGGKGGAPKNASEEIKTLLAEALAPVQEELKTLREENASLKQSRSAEARSAEVAALIQKLPEHLKAPYLIADYAAMTDEAYETAKASIASTTETILSKSKEEGVQFFQPGVFAPASTAQDTEATEEELNRALGIDTPPQTK